MQISYLYLIGFWWKEIIRKLCPCKYLHHQLLEYEIQIDIFDTENLSYLAGNQTAPTCLKWLLERKWSLSLKKIASQFQSFHFVTRHTSEKTQSSNIKIKIILNLKTFLFILVLGLSEDQANRQLMSRLKRKMQVSMGKQTHASERIQVSTWTQF